MNEDTFNALDAGDQILELGNLNVLLARYGKALVDNSQPLKYTSMITRVQVGDYAEISGQYRRGYADYAPLPIMIGRVTNLEYVEGWVPNTEVTQPWFWGVQNPLENITTYHWRATITFHNEDIDISGPLSDNQPRPPITVYWIDFVNRRFNGYNYVISRSSEEAYSTYMSAGFNAPALKSNIKF